MEQYVAHAGRYKPSIVLVYERIEFHISRDAFKCTILHVNKDNYKDYHEHFYHGKLTKVRKLKLTVSDIHKSDEE